jgi:large subunit ribosomal protein L23
MNLIISPLITEKSMQDAQNSKFTFQVAKFSNKNEIKKEIEKRFKVSVTHVSTNTVKGKSVRVGAKRTEKKLASWKKAIVTLKSGEKIGMFELGGEEKK